ncbi:FKBP-type peptidyl-prolyl cis-trans isomerase [Parabacteroides sp. OttesenSCG-928-K15]|nr:FKBP-type peptidyl-prolyl cis-trans isomerase [Parabacteroides sp. OttesenSCG-928-K15]
MKKYWYLLAMMVCALTVMTACGDDDEEGVSEEWKEVNRVEFLKVSGNKEYKELKSVSNGGSIYYKVIKEGTGTQPIYYNSTIKAYYTGTMINPDDYEKRYTFDKAEYPEQDPQTFAVNGVVDGWITALQHMKEGDRWEVWIPYQLAYGTSGSNKIPGFTTLKFEMEVVEIVAP